MKSKILNQGWFERRLCNPAYHNRLIGLKRKKNGKKMLDISRVWQKYKYNLAKEFQRKSIKPAGNCWRRWLQPNYSQYGWKLLYFVCFRFHLGHPSFTYFSQHLALTNCEVLVTVFMPAIINGLKSQLATSSNWKVANKISLLYFTQKWRQSWWVR